MAIWTIFNHKISFQSCLHDCSPKACDSALPFSLRITMWTCQDDCAYQCSHSVTDAAQARIIAQHGATAVRIEQFYGKWAFWRFLGMQEPASVLFSLMNLQAHVKGFFLLRRRVAQSHPMIPYYLTWSICSINAWIWSAVFHTRDKPFTEKLDYFSAGLSILFGLYLAVIRLFHLYSDSQHPSVLKALIRHTWSILCTISYLSHVSYLTFATRFDYGYNILANVVVGMTHNVLWILFAIPATPFTRYPASRHPAESLVRNPHQRSRRWVTRPLWCVLLTTLATMLELFDFPPWYRVIDAHSLWHLATAFIIPLWYDFLVEDSLDEGWAWHKLQ
ncbi:Per1-like protein [Clavulina sp. PMI_390]|nr:Per1-like protein [Clavulina sp. PMI_390]